MKTIRQLTIVFAVIFATITQAQPYVAVGSSYAKIPHTNKFTPNGIITAGVVSGIFDVSINVEIVELSPNYLSYSGQVMVKPFEELYGIELLIGGKFGRVLRDNAAYRYYGVTGELRYGKKFFVSLVGNYDYRADIKYWWGKDYMVFTSHLKIGYKFN